MAFVPDARVQIYEPLPSPTHIRLLRRLPEDKAAETPVPRLYLETYDLPSCPKFTALSYTWGPCVDDKDSSSYNNSEDFRVECNGQLCIVTENLYHFLDSCAQDYLWVDALCINQEDVNERATQVSFMGRIYISANIVIMWLGRDTSDLDKFVFLHERFLQEVDKRDIDIFTQSLWDLPFLREIGIESTEQWREYWQAYHRFYHRRRFFYRAWIVQEYALARRQVFACGRNLTLLHANLMNRLSTYVLNGLWYEELEYFDLSFDKMAYPMDIMLNTRGILFEERLDSREFQVTKGGPEGVLQKRKYESMYGATTLETRWFCFLLSLLCMNRALGATDARDKVYSVLGLANLHLPKNSPLPIVPDYHLTMREIFISVSWQILQSIPYLAILSEVHDRPGDRNKSLPS